MSDVKSSLSKNLLRSLEPCSPWLKYLFFLVDKPRFSDFFFVFYFFFLTRNVFHLLIYLFYLILSWSINIVTSLFHVFWRCYSLRIILVLIYGHFVQRSAFCIVFISVWNFLNFVYTSRELLKLYQAGIFRITRAELNNESQTKSVTIYDR